MRVREPVVAGQFYPGIKRDLERALSKLVDVKKKKEDALGAISPHAGYIYSGGVAGKVLSLLMPKSLFIIIGPNHTGMGRRFSVYAEGAWKTPLGEVEVDATFADYLVRHSCLFEQDELAHVYEHSIEVQLPFLQYMTNDFKILPICVSSTNIGELKRAGEEIASAAKKLRTDVTIIASSDMTHYEHHEAAKKKDAEALSAVTQMDEDKLIEKVNELDISMCGVAPVSIMLTATKAMGAKEAKVIEYKTSGDAAGDYTSVVGYGGVIIT